MSVKKNDWVRSYSAGVWRVSAEVPAHFEPRASLQEPKELYLEEGVTCDQILRAISKTPYAEFCGEAPQSATLQFVNCGHEIRRRELIYRRMVGLDF
jgi:hypothetical protein